MYKSDFHPNNLVQLLVVFWLHDKPSTHLHNLSSDEWQYQQIDSHLPSKPWSPRFEVMIWHLLLFEHHPYKVWLAFLQMFLIRDTIDSESFHQTCPLFLLLKPIANYLKFLRRIGIYLTNHPLVNGLLLDLSWLHLKISPCHHLLPPRMKLWSCHFLIDHQHYYLWIVCWLIDLLLNQYKVIDQKHNFQQISSLDHLMLRLPCHIDYHCLYLLHLQSYC